MTTRLNLLEPANPVIRRFANSTRARLDSTTWPTAEALVAITEELTSTVVSQLRPRPQRLHPLSRLLSKADARWDLGIVDHISTLNGAKTHIHPSPICTAITKLQSSPTSPDAQFALLTLSKVFAGAPNMLCPTVEAKELINYRPRLSAKKLSSTESSILMPLLSPDVRSGLEKLRSSTPDQQEVEFIGTVASQNLMISATTWHQALNGGAGIVPWLDWLALIEDFDALAQLERGIFWPGALRIDEIKIQRRREKDAQRKRRQRERDRLSQRDIA